MGPSRESRPNKKSKSSWHLFVSWLGNHICPHFPLSVIGSFFTALCVIIECLEWTYGVAWTRLEYWWISKGIWPFQECTKPKLNTKTHLWNPTLYTFRVWELLFSQCLKINRNVSFDFSRKNSQFWKWCVNSQISLLFKNKRKCVKWDDFQTLRLSGLSPVLGASWPSHRFA